MTLAEADNLPASVDYFTLIDTVEGLQVPMPVDLDTGSLLLAAQNSGQTYISVTDDLTNFTDFPAGFLSNPLPPITVTGVTLADVPGGLPVGIDSYMLADSVDGLQAPMPVNVENALKLLGAANGSRPQPVSLSPTTRPR